MFSLRPLRLRIWQSVLAVCLFGAGHSAFAQDHPPVQLHWLNGAPKETTGVSWGLPWPQGQIKKTTQFALTRDDGSQLANQNWPLAYWPDGSVKWTGFAAVLDSGSDNFAIHPINTKPAPAPAANRNLQVTEDDRSVHINTGAMQCAIARSGTSLIQSITFNGQTMATSGRLTCILQDRPDAGAEIGSSPVKQKYMAAVSSVTLEQTGPLRAVLRVDGRFSATSDHQNPPVATAARNFMPFVLRLYFYSGVSNIRLLHTIIFDGDDQKDFIKGIGITFDVPFREQLQNRYVRFSGEEDGIWAEPVQPLNGRRPSSYIADQAAGRPIPNVETVPNQKALFDNMASWNDYLLTQGSADGFNIRKRTNNSSSWLDVIGGKRATGLAFVGDVTGGLALSVKNFWQSYPSALEINGARTPAASLTAWLWSPYADAMDLRHYDTTAHDLNITYEDVQPGFSTPYGIGRTSELMITPCSTLPTNARLAENASANNNTALLAASPEYLHQVGALGLWSLPDRSSKGKRWIEDQLDKAVAFYKQEVDRREWYGFWNYGDVMHSYDASRHAWKYDIGGFAWDNTELSTDLWLWYSFLRSGRADIFKMAEAMTRHTSEVDCYHLGPMMGLGSRHNVNHWGDGSKEARESQAILRRCFYYLTTDERTGDIMRQSALYADSGLAHVDPLREILPRDKYPTHARFGPDWLALAGNWMTEWERTGDIKWKNKILTGVNDFAKMPHGFYSGRGKDAGMGYDPATNHIYQLDPNDIGSSHLATLMGGQEMAYELTPLLNNKEWNRLYLQYCSLYGAPLEDVQAAFGQDVKTRLGDPQGDYARQPAYAYIMTRDPKYAQRAWEYFLPKPDSRFGGARFDSKQLGGPEVVKPLAEIRNVSTNSTAQWCLNAIEILQMVGDQMPEHNIAWDGPSAASQPPGSPSHGPAGNISGSTIFSDDFDGPLDPATWVIEMEPKPDARSSVYTKDHALILDTRGGVTVWLNKPLSGNLQIEYDRKVLVDTGKNDRLSDLNQFWMARDPHEINLFSRHGKFETYDNLVLYYVGMGGNGNKTTRFRKYLENGTKPVIREYLDALHLLEANTNYHIKIVVQNGTTSYWVNDDCYFSYADPSPLTSGYFGFRSTWSRQEIKNLRLVKP
jgi:hypothetical protein